MEVGAFFQCHKQPVATFYALTHFRAAYPNTTIILLSDNGYDYSAMANKFNAIYIHSIISAPVTCRNAKNHDAYKIFLYRLRDALQHMKESHFMLLEDDVYVRAPYTEPFLGTISGNCINSIKEETFKAISYYTGDCSTRFYTGHGGAIYNTQQFLDILGHAAEIDWLIDNWSTLHRGLVLDCDVFCCILCYTLGGSIHPMQQHKDGVKYMQIAHVTHQCKQFYNAIPDESIKQLYSESL